MMPGDRERVFYVTGIDTDIGKTVATGILARSCLCCGIQAITQKMVQTGCLGASEDIAMHRRLMGTAFLDVDLDGLTCPYVFPVPCSPHLAAKLVGQKIVPANIAEATHALENRFEIVFVEGAGGLLVPLTDDVTFLDYLVAYPHPLIVVTSPRLGSINHTLAVLELARWRGVEVAAIIYNLWESQDARIVADSKAIFALYMQKNAFTGPVLELPRIGEDDFCFSKNDIYALTGWGKEVNDSRSA
jgi:dethiobiotin synthetase